MNVGTRFFSISLIFFSMLFGFVNQAEASHFRYGNITWTIPDPVGAPRTVRFTVETAWRGDFIDGTQLEFGDGTNNGNQIGTTIGGGVDALGNAYAVQRYTATHTYAAAGGYTAFFASGDRVAGLINGANGPYRVETRVALGGGNTAGPVSRRRPSLTFRSAASGPTLFRLLTSMATQRLVVLAPTPRPESPPRRLLFLRAARPRALRLGRAAVC